MMPQSNDKQNKLPDITPRVKKRHVMHPTEDQWEEVKIFGKKLRELRVMAHMSQTALARRLHIGQATVARWEAGQVAGITNDIVDMVADTFGVTSAYMRGYEEADDPQELRMFTMNYLRLDPASRKMVDSLIEHLVELQAQSPDSSD